MQAVTNPADPGNGQPVQMLAGPRFLDNGPAPVPEPLTLSMVGGAMILFGARGWRRRIRR